MDKLKTRELGDDIWIYEDALSPELCARIIAQFDADPNKNKGLARAYDNREGSAIRISENPKWEELDRKVAGAVERVLSQHYSEYDCTGQFSDSGYEVVCYEAGQKCNTHRDGTINPETGYVRMWTLVFFLNDDCGGGELEFFRQGVEFKGPAGAAGVWPPHMSHPHAAHPVTDGCRYVVVTWSCLTPVAAG